MGEKFKMLGVFLKGRYQDFKVLKVEGGLALVGLGGLIGGLIKENYAVAFYGVVLAMFATYTAYRINSIWKKKK